MRRYGILGIGAAAVAALVVIPRSPAIAPAGLPAPNHPPVVTSSLPANASFPSRAPIRFTVTVTDPDNDAVFAKVVDAPREVGFAPIVNAPSGATREVVFYPSTDALNGRSDGGPQRLVVESWDVRQPWRKSQTTFRFRVIGGVSSHGLRLLQTDHDLAPEFVVRSKYGDVRLDGYPFYDAGAYVHFEPSSPSNGFALHHELWRARFPVSDGFTHATEQIGDVNGDGLDDLIAVHAQREVAIWFGGSLDDTRVPDVTLPLKDTYYFHNDTPSLLVTDVTGDGIDDVVVGCPWVTTKVASEGEVVVFAGGRGLARTTAPTATLRVAGASAFDALGRHADYLEPFLVGDVTGDGVADLVVVDPWVDLGASDVGAIYVWSGGAALAGTPAPVATLATTGFTKSKLLGLVDTAPAAFLVDVTGDGVLDMVAGSPKFLPDGAIFVWQGGSGITGTVAPTARLQPSPGGVGGGDLLDTDGWATQSLQFADLDLDGITDIVAARPLATLTSMPSLSGAVYFFAGGALSGTLTETALLRRATPKQDDRMSANGMQIVDVTGDGKPDLLCCSRGTDANAVDDGAIEVFAAGAGLSGTVTPSASLEVPGSSVQDFLTYAGGTYTGNWPTGLLVEDVTGDGIRDVIGAAPLANEAQLHDVGAIYVWTGGSSLTSGTSVAPTATLFGPNPRDYDGLAGRAGAGPAVRFADWDDDGVKDLVAIDGGGFPQSSNPGGIVRVLVWRGGATLTGMPSPLAIAASRQPDDAFGAAFPISDGLWLSDVTGDGSVDLLVAAPLFDTAAGKDAGAIYVFAGGAAASGALAPVALLTDRSGQEDDELGEFSEYRFVDVDRDGFDDLVVTQPNTRGTGRLLFFKGPIGSATTSIDASVLELGQKPGLGY